MNKFNTFLISILLVSSLSISNIATANDPAKTSKDSREAIVLTEKERDLVLVEMRSFLEAVQTIVVALSKDELAVVSTAAKKVGMAEQGGMPAALKEKLPKGFKILGMKTHKAFDQMALDAKDIEDKQQALEQLGALMKNCVSCHAAFKFKTDK